MLLPFLSLSSAYARDWLCALAFEASTKTNPTANKMFVLVIIGLLLSDVILLSINSIPRRQSTSKTNFSMLLMTKRPAPTAIVSLQLVFAGRQVDSNPDGIRKNS